MQRKEIDKKYEKITISFTEADTDIIDYVNELKRHSKASEFIREAIRDKMNSTNSNKASMNIKEESNYRIKELEERVSYIEKQLIASALSGSRIERSFQGEVASNVVTEEKNTEKENKEEIDEDMMNALNFFDL